MNPIFQADVDRLAGFELATCPAQLRLQSATPRTLHKVPGLIRPYHIDRTCFIKFRENTCCIQSNLVLKKWETTHQSKKNKKFKST